MGAFRDRTAGMRRGSLVRDLGLSGVLMFVGVVALIAGIVFLFPLLRPPTVEELEQDIWRDWARFATDSQGLTIVDQLLEDRQAAGRQLLETIGRLIENEGDRFVVRTAVRRIEIRRKDGSVFASWGTADAQERGHGWKELRIPVDDPFEGTIGSLDVVYRFYGSGLDSLPNIRRLQFLYQAAVWLVGLLAMILFIAILANIARLYERSARLRTQQIALELARQMCHELRNGLWAFTLEGRNLEQLFNMVDDYFRLEPEIRNKAWEASGVDARTREQFEFRLRRAFAKQHLDPQTDLLPTNTMARQAERQIASFAKFISLTVEELDRYLLGQDETWSPTRFFPKEAWEDACELLRLRFQASGVAHRATVESPERAIFVDRRAMLHVLVNLVKNAIEAMRDGGDERVVEFTVSSEGSWVTCAVKNRGEPIPSSALPHLFEPGFSTKSGGRRGTGLALVRECVEKMKGSVTVESTRESGTIFRIRLPAAPQEN